MKKVLLVILLFTSLAAVAQERSYEKGNGKISGTVIDSETKQPVEFATIALTFPDNIDKPLDGTVCDDKGKFTLKNVGVGSYKIVVSFIGFETQTFDVEIADNKDDADLGTISLASSAKILGEVTVEGQKALIEERVDRTIYNAENDATTKGGDASDVLKRVPMLSVDMDGNVSLRGNSNIRVLINNKPSTIAASSVADALKQIPADQIKSVEVITSPSAKYDAEGSAGIINIITKKNTLQGLTLNVNGSAGMRGSNLGLNGNYRQGKMGFSLGGWGRASYNVNGAFENNQTTLTDPDNDGVYDTRLTTIQSADTRNQNLFGNYTLGWDWDITKNDFVVASVRYGVRNGNNYQDNLLTQSFQDDIATNSLLQKVNTADESGTVDANLTYTHIYSKPQREFSMLASYSRNNRQNNFERKVLEGNGTSTLNLNDSYNQEVTIQADYQTPFGKTQLLEMGAKEILRKVSSDYQYFFADDEGDYVAATGEQYTNTFNYQQNITAGYLAYTVTLPKSYSLKAGARYEYTTISANFKKEEEVNLPSYGVLVPSVNISKKLKGGNTIKASYNRRIQRPSIQFLNPNIQSSNPLNVSMGNPNLQPEYTNNYELSYSTFIKGTTLNFSTFVRQTHDAIQSIRDVNQDTIRTTYQNIGKEDAYGGSLFANVNIGGKLTLSGGTDIYYAVLNNNNPDPLYRASNEGWVMSGRMFGSYNLSKSWSLQFFGFYRGRRVQPQGFQGGFGIYSLSVQKEFANKKASIGIGAENFFTSSLKIRTETQSALINQSSVNTMRNMNFKVNFNFRIGKMTMDPNAARKRRHSINNDDLKDGGDGGIDGGQPQNGGTQGAPAQRGGRGNTAPAPQKKPNTN